jgi:DNA-binding CsgD family transcriptional regulator
MTTAAQAESGTALSDPRDMLGRVQTQSVSPVFVGRDRELTRLTSALACAHAGEPQSLLMGGEAGVGKSRLLEQFLGAALATADRLGALPLRAEAAQLAERGRVTLEDTAGGTAEPTPAEPGEPFGLTSREREVLRRVAAGYTNRRIAEELFISPKTASVHVSNILAKLGVTGRGEAAALAHRLRLFPAAPTG